MEPARPILSISIDLEPRNPLGEQLRTKIQTVRSSGAYPTPVSTPVQTTERSRSTSVRKLIAPPPIMTESRNKTVQRYDRHVALDQLYALWPSKPPETPRTGRSDENSPASSTPR